jgi:hypothetical protein
MQCISICILVSEAETQTLEFLETVPVFHKTVLFSSPQCQTGLHSNVFHIKHGKIVCL